MRLAARPARRARRLLENPRMTPTYEISLLLPDPHDPRPRTIRVSAAYIDKEQSLNSAQKTAIRALPPGGVWTGHAIQIKRLAEGPAA